MIKIVRRRRASRGKAGSVVADVQAVVATNTTGGRGGAVGESSHQRLRVVQRNGRTEVSEG